MIFLNFLNLPGVDFGKIKKSLKGGGVLCLVTYVQYG